MTDWLTNRGSYATNDNELRFSRSQGFFDKSGFVRVLIGVAFAAALFLVLHFREVPVEILELNTTASRYVVAQVPFEFVDEEATLILRQEAVRDIGRIYKITEKQINMRRSELEDELYQNEEMRRQLKSEDLEEVYRVLDVLQQSMRQMYLTDPRTIQKLQEVGSYTDNFQIYTPLDLNVEVQLPQQIWAHIQKIYFPREEYRPDIVELVIDFFRSKGWKIEDDISTQRRLKKKVQTEIPDKYTHIGAGSRIIDQGERVTSRHIAMLQAMKQSLNDRRNLSHPSTLFGTLLMTFVLCGVCIAFVYVNFPQIIISNRKLCLLAAIFVITLFLGKAVEYYLLTSRSNLYDLVRYPLLIPFAAILTANLLSARLAAVVGGFLTIFLAITLAFHTEGFMLMNLVGGLTAILSTRSLRRRKELFAVCVKVWLSCVMVIFALHFYRGSAGTFSVVADLISSALFMSMTVVVILGVLPLLESTFKVMSDVTLIEFMDPNNELLRRLSFEAPGTYQHTLVVCNLAEAAAMSIGANGLFCRVSCLYHDIGKMTTPQYFTENQQSGIDMHKLLTPVESAQAIIAHVGEGVAMARKAGLPEQFIDVIKEHHGTTLVYYFYRKQLEQVGGDPSLIDETEFRYIGPKPRSKESAIIMIADSFEAASRSLDHVEENELMELINRLIKEKADDGQFDDCLLTFEELRIVKQNMVQTLVAAHHSRVKYPQKELRE